MERLIRDVGELLAICASRSYLSKRRAESEESGIASAVAAHDTPPLFDWLMVGLSYQGVSDAIAQRFIDEHGSVSFHEVEAALRQSPSCSRLRSYWHFADCGYAKLARACSEPTHLGACPLPSHDLRNGRLNQTAYALFLFLRDICHGDLVAWIDERLAAADDPTSPQRAARMRQALLEPLAYIHGVSGKVLSMMLAALLLSADPNRERWVTTGAKHGGRRRAGAQLAAPQRLLTSARRRARLWSGVLPTARLRQHH